MGSHGTACKACQTYDTQNTHFTSFYIVTSPHASLKSNLMENHSSSIASIWKYLISIYPYIYIYQYHQISSDLNRSYEILQIKIIKLYVLDLSSGRFSFSVGVGCSNPMDRDCVIGGSTQCTVSFPFLSGSGKSYPIGSMYGIYANIGDILMVNVIAYMDPMGTD